MADVLRRELFHRIADPDSAEARRRAVALELAGRIEFRNVDFESHRAALAGRGGGDTTPALWDGVRLHVGREAVLGALEALAREITGGPSAPARRREG
jgi:hypothetical protein